MKAYRAVRQSETAKRVPARTLSTRTLREIDDTSLHPDQGRLRAIAGPEFGQDVLHSTLHGEFRDPELIGDLFVRFACRDQA
jgi:hypothetical protein